ncbi:MAG: ferrochelatase [Magnetococcales bacterium]|nr:ferrochelatase [Magnetococcales bacterium]
MSDVGVILAQLGTPDAPKTPALRRYLAQFLSDPRVVDLPRWKWWPILHGIILRTRPKRSAALYRRIWREDGISPLLHHTRVLTDHLQQALGDEIPVRLGMRYGQPALDHAVDELRALGVSKLLLFPLFPQYSGATNASMVDALYQAIHAKRHLPALRVAPSFHNHPGYIASLAHRIRQSADPDANQERLYLFSFHGLPQRHVDQGDPYEAQCHVTAQKLAEALNLPKSRWRIAFQSRFGKEPWLLPATDQMLAELPNKGHKEVVLACPGFVSDCLETLEEIAIGGKKIFLEAGGTQFIYTRCINDDAAWREALVQLVKRELMGWC